MRYFTTVTHFFLSYRSTIIAFFIPLQGEKVMG